MILSEKIMSLRKQNGWSQEDLSEKLDVSRQSVSKWESGASIPDIEKIVKMSQIFSVSTDYLLKDSDDDEMPDSVPVFEKENEADTLSQAKAISMEFATEFMDATKNASKKIATGVTLCITSPIILIILGALYESPAYNVSEGLAVGVGLAALFVMIACAVLMFIMEGMKLSKYEFLEKEPIKLMYGVEAVVNRKKEAFDPSFRMSIAVGVIFCILSVVPICIASAARASDLICSVMIGVLLVLVSIGVFLFVSSGMVHSSHTKLLQEEDYTVESKENNKRNQGAYGAYWCLVTAGYLAWSFITNGWDHTWIIWPVAGVLFMPYKLIVDFLRNRD